MKRILALDGGGIRGVATLQILARIEAEFRAERNRPDLVLGDVFDFFAGTSAGAIIAAGLCWGMTVADIERLYVEHGTRMFFLAPWYLRWKAKYQADRLAEMFRSIFVEEDGSLADLGSAKLRGILLAVMRNATTGSAWPVSSIPGARFNDPTLEDCNLRIPLWQVLRASTAAPTFFAPERIRLGDRDYLFVDGAITPYNNPALIAVLAATLPCYGLGWPAGREALHVVSVGVGGGRSRLAKTLAHEVHLLDLASYVPNALIASTSLQQDALCRILGDCLYGAPIDLEVGDLCAASLFPPSEQKFSYVRYDPRLDPETDAATAPIREAAIDDLAQIPHLQSIGKKYAERHVKREHLYPRGSTKDATAAIESPASTSTV